MSGHGTGYEDALARRIAGIEAGAKECAERLARAQATVEELTRDNATLRLRASAAEARARRMGGFVVLAALAALLVVGGAAWLLLVAAPAR
ncbi:MAG: hypothetical protein ABIP29_11665 [Candidatus Eisenbacteria bacterium]